MLQRGSDGDPIWPRGHHVITKHRTQSQHILRIKSSGISKLSMRLLRDNLRVARRQYVNVSISIFEMVVHSPNNQIIFKYFSFTSRATLYCGRWINSEF